MQIVRELAGYSYGRSDLVRRAMSKKKADVMAKERQNFVYGNEAEGVPGCKAKGISEEVAHKIFDEMTDFAKYAFNKSHAACYAVVAYRTAYLKQYYPVEFMAALITSVIDNPGKVASYVHNIKTMGIKILPPDINLCRSEFSVDGNNIRYGLSAIKGLGRPVIEAIVNERENNGRFRDIKDFCERLSGKEVNKRTVESFIKAGAFDGMPGTRKQLMCIYQQVMDGVARDKKKNLTGQMSLFDLMQQDDDTQTDIMTYPEVGEYSRQELLIFEKEVLGIYVSGHPLDDYSDIIIQNITRLSSAFALDEETSLPEVTQDSVEIIAGIVSDKTVKTTRNNTLMCFATIEDTVGVVEVVVFPKDYEKYKYILVPDNKVFIKGRVSIEEDKPAKLICQNVISFKDMPKELWIKYKSIDSAKADDLKLKNLIANYPGESKVVLYCEQEKAMKRLPDNITVRIDDDTMSVFESVYSAGNVSAKTISLKKYFGRK